ncbi:MAG: tetratricopeptide repeat protein [bacterium]|nr:tetratricopeptide repeat protein [bacterium]
MDKEFDSLIRKAEVGDVKTMLIVADCFNKGLYTEKNDTKAQKYYKMAADKGDPKASFMTALGYLFGTGTKKNKIKAWLYMQFAAEKGVADAQYSLGELYKIGEMGVIFKKQRALQYLEMASKQGHAKAQIALGDLNIQTKGRHDCTIENGVFWIVCAFLHGNSAEEESREAKIRLDILVERGLVGGEDYINNMINYIKRDYPTYTKNPK